MKVRFLGLLLLAVLTFFACDDNTSSLGIDMLPATDGVTAHATTFPVTTRSVKAENVYSKTSTGYVGRFSDPEFGYYESSFLTELNCTDNFEFPEPYKYDEATETGTGYMAGDTVAAAQLVFFYSTWFGDSLNACRMSVYELNDEWLADRKEAKKAYRYTDFDASKYYSESTLIGRKAYTAYDTSVPDSVREETDIYGYSTYYPSIVFPMDKEWANEVLRKNREQKDGFKDSEYFINNIFKGIYAKTDLGDGTILYIDRVDLQMRFRFHYTNDTTGVALKKSDGTDSLYYSTATVFASTKEVVQANKFRNSDKIQEKVDENGWTYIKSPAGIFTEATLPYGKIYEELASDTLNSVKLTFTNYNQKSDYEFSMSTPTNVLLIRKGNYEAFFEENQLPNNVTSYTVAHNSVATNQYTFSNIARLVNYCINEKNEARDKAREAAGSTWNEAAWEATWTAENPDWDKVLLIPVTVTYDSSSSSSTMIGIQNDLKPSYAKLKGGPEGDDLLLEVIYTKFASK